MITVRTSPAYVNRVRESWQQGGGVDSLPPDYDPLAYTLNLDFINEVYEIFEYGPLDASLNLDFVNQTYQSE